jgi:hypothetical protein
MANYPSLSRRSPPPEAAVSYTSTSGEWVPMEVYRHQATDRLLRQAMALLALGTSDSGGTSARVTADPQTRVHVLSTRRG